MNEIAYAWGFSDPTHIGRQFKKMFGASPAKCPSRKTPDRQATFECAHAQNRVKQPPAVPLTARGYAVTRAMESAQTAILAVILHDLVSEHHVVP